jgi:pentapeptide MXKDX repeat protein
MKRITLLVATALVAVMLMAPAAFAQDTMGDTMGDTGGGTTMMGGDTGMMGGDTEMMGATTSGTGSDLPDSGGPAILLPAAALLLGSGILTYAVLRRR